MAGFIDADGSITIVSAKAGRVVQYRAKLSASNCKIAPIRLLQKTFGTGKVRLRKWKGVKKRHWRPNYEWIVTNNQAVTAIMAMLPYLLVKQKQGLHCLVLQRLKAEHTSARKRWDVKLNNRLQSKYKSLKHKCNILNRRGK